MKNPTIRHGAILLTLLACTAFGVRAQQPPPADTQQQEAVWLTSFEKAQEIAGQQNRPIIVNFSGSDWCGWCKRLDAEVFSKPEFLNYAKDNAVLFNADFPRSKPLPAEIKTQNDALAKKYQIKGFPTVLLLDKNGKVLAETGYQPGGAEKYVKHLSGLLGAKK